VIDLRHGDCVEVLRDLDEHSVDAVVTDPPYGIRFMGKAWDGEDIVRRVASRSHETRRGIRPDTGKPYSHHIGGKGALHAGEYDHSLSGHRALQAWCEEWGSECLRVLKPGGHIVVFGSTRTYHRLTSGLEDAGFQIRDTLAWMFGQGFPKSLDVSKAIDKHLGAERPVVGRRMDGAGNGSVVGLGSQRTMETEFDVTDPATAAAGLGTALKPAFEPIVLARKPLDGTVAENVLEHGTGALRLGDCGVLLGEDEANAADDESPRRPRAAGGATSFAMTSGRVPTDARWPANVILDEDAAAMLDEQSGELVSGANPTRRGSDKFRHIYSGFAGQEECEPKRGADRGGASRFFYCPKVSSAERHEGLAVPSLFAPGAPERNDHPTVKPIALMRWLVRLITPTGGLVLDPFLGSGTSGIAAALEGCDFIGIEREARYVDIARARIAHWTTSVSLFAQEQTA